MSAPVIEFARGLELVCRHINPPAAPLPEPIPLPYLGLDGIPLRGDDPRLAYRYLRGLEIPGSRSSLVPAKPVWAAERGLIAQPTAALEVEPGVLAIGDATGVVRLFVRAGRARWECAAALPSHWEAVRDMCVLAHGGFVSVGDDGGVVFYERDWRGSWRYAVPRIATVSSGRLVAVCQLADETVLAGGDAGRLVELNRFPSGDWEGRETSALADGAEISALAPWTENGYCAVQSGRLTCWLRSPDRVRSLGAPPPVGGVTDIASWSAGVIACTDAGELVRYWPNTNDGQHVVEMVGDRAASARMQGIRALDAENVVTWSEDQQVRIWKAQERGFTLRAAFPGALLTRRCFAVLSDQRIALSETRAFTVAAPQLDGTWRADELVSAAEAPVTTLAALARDRVAAVNGTDLHILSNTLEGPIRVDRLLLGYTAIAAVAPLDPSTVLVGGANGRMCFARQEADGWKVTEVRTPHRGAVEHLSAAGGHVASGETSGLVATWRWSQATLLANESFQEPGPLLALAVAADGRIATATRAEVVVRQLSGTPGSPPNEVARISTPVEYASLVWDAGELLAVEKGGTVSRIRLTPHVQLTPEWPAWSGSAPARLALVARAGPQPDGKLEIAYARGTAPVAVGPSVVLPQTHGQINALSSSQDVLYAGADALYICQPFANPPLMRRVVVTADAIVDARLSHGGVMSAVVRHREGERWTVVNVAGKAMPYDLVLHSLVAVVEESGQLGEVSTTGDFHVSAAGDELHVEDSTIPA